MYKDYLFFSKRDRVSIACLAIAVICLNAMRIVVPKTDFFRAKLYEEYKNATDRMLMEQPQVSVEINSADSLDFLPLPGIGPVFAGRIVKYRSRLGGFLYKSQLLEVYGFTQETLDKISSKITVDKSLVKKLDVNSLEFKEILRHPYIDYEMTKVIVNKRRKSPYSSLSDFMTRTDISDTLLLKYILLP
ncbi:MAG: helix-hairpin-helix domain-containing protein [Bacteroidales bacterium]|nr:helix-hairpin-helix domain-containing protein [Bacteroidales bacterium]